MPTTAILEAVYKAAPEAVSRVEEEGRALDNGHDAREALPNGVILRKPIVRKWYIVATVYAYTVHLLRNILSAGDTAPREDERGDI